MRHTSGYALRPDNRHMCRRKLLQSGLQAAQTERPWLCIRCRVVSAVQPVCVAGESHVQK